MYMPADVNMLLSLANTKLRDFYSSPQDMCAELDWDEEELSARLAAAGYIYDEKRNAYISK